MRQAHIIYNPEAGNKELTKEKLMALIEAEGFKCGYSSTKEEDEITISDDTEFLIVAGGDGTVRKVAMKLLKGKWKEKNLPIALLPIGIANNIAKTLQIKGTPEAIIQSWNNSTIKKYDVGFVEDTPGADFFLESIGFGLFPYLMRKMSRIEEETSLSSDESLETATRMLLEIIPEYDAHNCDIRIDGHELSGKFLMVEIMNIRSMGPNLNLAPFAEVSDGMLDVILIPETQREKLASYIVARLEGSSNGNSFQMLPAKKIIINWHSKHGHADDEQLTLEKKTEMKIEVKRGALDFLVP